MQHNEDEFVALMRSMLGDLSEPMTYEQAAMDAAADYRTEKQEARMGVSYE
ncbi:hypothetical protein QNA27_08880 [Pantoea eucalypti]|uniref:hypothetical protein n=1 Tax=Pantoea eucalypti TaxID=470933 RepID=UPI0024B9E9E1|nr:hypothetical protein [Pantoea eucalypti]MDJ0473764.1 hypothetical protein [Pantoea eucalypti]